MDRAPASGRGIVVVGASAGGVEALRVLAVGLPGDLPAAVLVVLHLPATAASVLPQILDRASPLPAGHAANGEALEAGRSLQAVKRGGGTASSRTPKTRHTRRCP